MSDVIAQTGRFIRTSGLFGRRKALLVGRAATGLMLLYEELTGPDGRVILPAIGCPSLLATVLLAGRRPVIVDVDRNLNIDPKRVMAVVREGDVVLGVHIFGIPCAIEELEKICRERGAILIEDAAQAIGSRVDGRPVGTFGIASVLSFAEGKILSTHGGGVILTDSDELFASLTDKVEKLPGRPDNIGAKARELRDVSTEAFNRARKGDRKAASVWSEEYSKHGEIFRHSIEPKEAVEITRAMRDLDRIAGMRREGVEKYREHLDGPDIDILEYPPGCSPFRFTFVAPRLTGPLVQEITEAIRSEGMHASNLYLPLHWLAPELVEAGECPRSEHAGVRIINLWLDEGIPERDAPKVAEIVAKWTGRRPTD